MQTCKNIILTGPPGSGKTTLLRRMKGIAKVVDEVARDIIREWDRGNKWGKGKNIQDEIYSRSLNEVEKATRGDDEWVVFDRTHIDCLAYGHVLDEPPKMIEDAEVWVLKFHPEWYKNDDQRKESPAEAKAVGERLKKVYRDLGYSVREIDAADPDTWPKWARKRLERKANVKIAKELIEISKLLIALDCDEFNADYAMLMRQYHTMHGPEKRQVKKTLDVMEKRLRDECDDGEKVQMVRGIRVVRDRNKDPDTLWRAKGDGATFFYFVKTGHAIWGDKKRTHPDVFLDNLGKLDHKDFGDSTLRLLRGAGLEDWQVSNPSFETNRDLRKNWDEFLAFVDDLGSGHKDIIREILSGGFKDEIAKGRILEEGVSFWGVGSRKPSMGTMVDFAKKHNIETLWLWQ